MNLGGWLRQLGLEHYEAAFRKKIDDTVLPSLTAEDLKDLGVRFVGDRRKLLDAIAALRAEASARRRHPTLSSQPRKPPRTPPSAVSSPGVRGVLIYCSDYRCSNSTCLDADR